MAVSEKRRSRFWIYLVGALLTGGLGLLLTFPLGDGLARLSYDLPFTLQSGNPTNVVMVYLNPQVKKNLGEPADVPLDRNYHTRLVERLHADGARLILFDFLNFDTPHPDPAVDQSFVEAARAHGRVVLLTQITPEVQMNVATHTLIPLALQVAPAAAAWGLAEVSQDSDASIRHMLMASNGLPSVGWVTAKLLNAPVTRSETNWLRERWLNYYGPPGCLRAVNYDHALETNGLPAGFFRDKIVIVCAGETLGSAGATQDMFPNPYCRIGLRHSFGGEVQAQTILNLLHGDWLERLNPGWEAAIVLAWGFLCAFGLSGRTPWSAALVSLLAVVFVAVLAVHLQLKHQLWWNWLIPVVQTPVALVWSVGYQYATEFRRRRQLRRAFGAYLSPYMADRIANSEFDLALGGKEVEATVMFTDLEGFTKMSESLPPAEVSKILTTYFNQTTRVILEQEGTIIKYIGDAVMAVWGAPLADPKHAERAVLAAWGMHEAGKQEVHGRRLRTRIGVNTGMVLAGNLGSDFRFDYTLIGDTTNFASRLEGLNKHLGTEILISEFTCAQIGDKIKLRNLGRFRVMGKAKAMGIYEVLGPAANFTPEPPWLGAFAEALEKFVRAEFDEAERLLRQSIASRDRKDGPAEFYLKEIAKARGRAESPEAWDGTVVFESK